MRMKSWQAWLIALVVTLSAAVYQRLTGPTWPLRGKAHLAGKSPIDCRDPMPAQGTP